MAKEKFIKREKPANNKFTSNLNMASRRKQIQEIYSGSDQGLRRIFDTASSSSATQRFNEAGLDRILNQVGLETLDREEVKMFSEHAYSTDPNYAALINYFRDMFLWRYYYFPVRIKENPSGDYKEVYNLMTEVIDGLSIEVTFPAILTKLFKEGVVYLYTIKNTSSKTISTIILNADYCKQVFMTQFGTGVFQFDLQYFDDLGLTTTELEEVLDFFPKELTSAYVEYKNGSGEQLIILDGRYSTFITLNENGFPDKLAVLKSLFDYEKYRDNEVERSSAQLDRVITHKIPTYENQLLFELPEVQALHRGMSRIITANNTNKRTRLMTTFGEVQVHPMQAESSVQNDSIKKGHEAIFRSGGLNTELFTGDIKESLDISLKRDESYVWTYIQQLLNFYNLTINNLYNFKGFQLELTLLPITHYNHKELMEMYRRNAEYGIGKIESVVASGTKQRHIQPKSELEEFLKLDEILKPLESSHTRSGAIEEEEEIPNEEKVVEEEVIEEESENPENEEEDSE